MDHRAEQRLMGSCGMSRREAEEAFREAAERHEAIRNAVDALYLQDNEFVVAATPGLHRAYL